VDQPGVKEGLTATAADCTLMVYSFGRCTSLWGWVRVG